METFSALMAPFVADSTHSGTVIKSFDIFFDFIPKRAIEQSVHLLAIWDAMTLMLPHNNIVIQSRSVLHLKLLS